MRQMKLKDFFLQCKKLMNKGLGDKTLIVSNDNEGNGYHGMFYTLTDVTEEDAKYYEGLVYDSIEEDLTNCIIVG